MRYSRLFVCSFILTFISACGSSGGGGTNGYEGVADQAQLTRQNAIAFLSAVYELNEFSISLVSIVDYLPAPDFLTIESSFRLTQGCKEGTYEIKDQRSANNISGKLKVTFQHCIIGKNKYSGDINVEIEDQKGEGASYSIDVRGLSRAGANDEITLDGNINYHKGKITTTSELIVTSDQLDKKFKLTEYSYFNSQVSGKLYDSLAGWVKFSKSAGINRITLEGDKSSILTADYDDSFYSYSDEEAILELIFSADANLDMEPDKLKTDISVSLLKSYPYRENTAPVSTTAVEITAERLENKKLLATSADAQADFITYKWKYITAPPGCEFELPQTNYDLISVVFPCQGEHVLGLSIFDGFNETTSVITIDVIPLLAEVVPVERVQLGLDDGLDVALDVLNISTDGPFTFAIAYAPSGVIIDRSGRVTGRPKPFVSSGKEIFQIAVDIDNGRKKTVYFSVEMESLKPERTLLASMDLCYTNHKRLADIDGNGKANIICSMADSYQLLEIDENKINLVYTEMTPPSDTDLISFTQYDFNNDGVDEIVLGYQREIFVINGADKKIIRSVELPAATDSVYYRNYKIYQLNYSFDGLAIYVDGGDDAGHYLIEFNGDDNLITKMPSESYTFDAVANVDMDKRPEFLSRDGLHLVDFDGTTTKLPSMVNYLKDMDGNGTTDLVYLSNGDEYYERNFELTIIDALTLKTTLSQTITVPESFAETWGGTGHIVNVDNDPEQEVILHFESIHKLFVFDYDGSKYILSHEIDTPADSNNSKIAIKNLDDSRILVTFLASQSRFYSYSIDQGFNTLALTSPAFYEVSMPTLNKFGNLEFFFKDAFSAQNTLSRIEMDQDGLVTVLEKTDIPSPYSMKGLMLAGVTSADRNEVLMSHSPDGQGYKVYDIDTQELLIETSFTPLVGWPASFIKADVDNNGSTDFFAHSSGANPISWIDPVNDSVNWNLDLGNSNSGIWAPHFSDLNGNGFPDLVLGMNSSENGKELHIYEWTGREFDRRNVFSYQHIEKLYYGLTFGMQDVDGDGKLEIIVANTKIDCDDQTENSLIILDEDLTVMAESISKACIQSIPTFDSGGAKNNLIVSSKKTNLRAKKGIASPAYTVFEELDIYSGDSIWSSSSFFGSLNPDSIVFFGENYADRKAAVFDYGVYTFR